MNHLKERRSAPRVSLKASTFAAVNDLNVIGQVADISKGGLLFQYANYESVFDMRVFDGSMVLGGNGVFVKGLKFHVVEERPIIQTESFSVLDMRSVRVHFEDISAEQAMSLEDYIQANSDGYYAAQPEAIKPQ